MVYLGADVPNLPIYVIGFTARMERSDQQELGSVFDEITYYRDLSTMIKDGELVNGKFYSVETNLHLECTKSGFIT